MLERLARGKHLLPKAINYGRKKFCSTGPWCHDHGNIISIECSLELEHILAVKGSFTRESNFALSLQVYKTFYALNALA
jgi:hypothetical protein